MGMMSLEEMLFARKVITQILCMAVVSFGVMSSSAVDWSGKKISISGDSYSAYGTNQHYPGKTGVQSESQMWWRQVISHFGGELEANGSKAGSAISYTYGVCPSIPYLAQDGKLGDPDIILIMGGLNDFWVLGVNEATFSSKVHAFFNVLDAGYPQAEKIVILNKIHSNIDAKWGLAPMYRNVLRELAKGRGYRVVDLEGYVGMDDCDFDTPEYPHPTRQGQTKIAQRVISALEHDNDYSRLRDTLEMDDLGYMVTDYVPHLSKTEIDVKMRLVNGETSVSNTIFYASGYTAGDENAGCMMSLVWSTGGIRFLNSTDGGITNIAPRMSITPDPDEKVVDITACGNWLTVGDYTIASRLAASNVRASGNMVIGAMRDGGSSTANYVGMGVKKIYNIKIKENGVVVRDYYPALNLEGKATLYDKVTETCLAVYGGGNMHAVDFEGPYVNYSQYMSYEDFYEAYAAANPGETVVIQEAPPEFVSVTGRMDVAIDTRGFGNIEILSPGLEYKVYHDGTVYRLGKNYELIPRFACEKLSDVFVPVDGKLRFHIANVVDGYTYSVYVTEDLTAGWRKIGEGFERADFEVDAPVGASSFFVKTVMRQGE